MSARERLRDRRAAELIDFQHLGVKWTASVSRFGDGKLAEIFLSTGKVSQLAEMAAESAIVVSIALQHGAPLDVLLHALSGHGAGPLAKALALAEETT